MQPFGPTAGGARGNSDVSELRTRARLERELASGRVLNRRGEVVSPEDAVIQAQVEARTAGLSCQVTEARLLGVTSDNSDLYEAACNGGVGYILQASAPPKAFDCLLLAGQAEAVRAEGGEVAPNSVCVLPGNQNGLAVMTGYAREAGVPCEVDAGKVVGATPEGNIVYEVGCAGADGYHIEKAAQGWNKTDCLEVIGMNLTCQFTTAQEQAAGFKPLLVGTAIDDCDAQAIRLLAQNDTGRFIEISCGSGDGFVARVKDNAVAQVYPCSAAQRIGGGCTLTGAARAPEQQ